MKYKTHDYAELDKDTDLFLYDGPKWSITSWSRPAKQGELHAQGTHNGHCWEVGWGDGYGVDSGRTSSKGRSFELHINDCDEEGYNDDDYEDT